MEQSLPLRGEVPAWEWSKQENRDGETENDSELQNLPTFDVLPVIEGKFPLLLKPNSAIVSDICNWKGPN